MNTDRSTDETPPVASPLPPASASSTEPYVPIREEPSTIAESPLGGDGRAAPRVLGDYELLEPLGKGGMGEVYKARQRSANRLVALKLIRTDRLAGLSPEQRRQWVERFRTEAQATARLDHERVVTVYEVGEAEGCPFYSMRYVEGRSLADLVQEGPLPGAAAADYLEPVARAVHHAHTYGILHRDLKPRNILVDGADRTYVADFGLAKWVESAEAPTEGPAHEADTAPEAGLTRPGSALGTPEYMPPEQAEDARQASTLSDVYSLGATLYALLTGRPPFRGRTPAETIELVISQAPVPPRHFNPAVPRDLEAIALKCLDKEPSRRYPSAQALADDLHRFLQGEPVEARPAGHAERLWCWCRRNPKLAASVAVAFLALLVGTVGTGIGLFRAKAEQAQKEEEAERRLEAEADKLREEEKRTAEAHAAAVRFAMSRGQWREALRRSEQALQAPYRDHVDAVGLRLERVKALNALYEHEQMRREIDELKGMGDLGGRDGLLLLLQADAILVKRDRKEDPLRLLNEAVRRGLPPAERSYAEALRAANSPEAVRRLQECLARDKYHLRARYTLGLLLLILGRLEEAREQALLAEVLHPEDATFPILRAIAHALRDEQDQVRALLVRVRDQFGAENEAAIRGALEMLSLTIREFDRSPSIHSDVDQARGQEVIRQLQRVLEAPGKPLLLAPPPFMAQVWQHMQEAVKWRALYNQFEQPALLQQSDDAFRQATAAHPEGYLLFLRGLSLFEGDRFAEGEQVFLAAAETPAVVPVRRKALFLAMGAAMRQATPHTGEAHDAHMRRAAAHAWKLHQLGGWRKDEMQYAQGIAVLAGDEALVRVLSTEWERIAPDDYVLWIGRAALEQRQGNYDRAVEAAERAVEKAPNSPWAKNSLARVCDRQKKYHEALRKPVVEGNAVLRGKAGPSEIVLTTTSRVAGAVHSLTWNGKEFLDSYDHGRQMQSAANFDAGGPFVPEVFNPTEAGSRADGTGNRTTSRLLRFKASGTELQTLTQMAFWLRPGEKSAGNRARNDMLLSEHLLAKRVRIGHKALLHAIEYEVTFTVPAGEKHTYAQFEALTGYLPAEFSRFWKYDGATAKLRPLDDGPGEQADPVVLATANGSHAMGVYSPDQPSAGYEKAGYGRFRFKEEKVNKWNCVFRVRDAKGIAAGEYRYRVFVVVGSLADVEATLAALHQEFRRP